MLIFKKMFLLTDINKTNVAMIMILYAWNKINK